MAWKLTISGDDHTAYVDRDAGVSVDWQLSGRATATFTLLEEQLPAGAGPYLPAILDPVVIYDTDGTTKIFGGIILPGGRQIEYSIGPGAYRRIRITCGDWSTYADWCFTTVAHGYPAATQVMQDILGDIVDDYLDRYGITYTSGGASQDINGPFAWDTKRVSDCLRDLSERCKRQWWITPDKALEMLAIPFEAGPATLTDATPNCQWINWSDSQQADAVPTDVVLQYGPSGGFVVVEYSWVYVNGVHAWTPSESQVVPVGRVWVTNAGAGTQFSYEFGPTTGSGYPYNWDVATHTMNQNTAPDLVAGDVLSFSVNSYFPQFVRSTSGATPIIEALYRREDIVDRAAASQAAQAILDTFGTATTTVQFMSFVHGWKPGQSVVIDLTAADLDLTANITAVGLRIITDTWWEYTVTATASATYQGSYLDQWRAMISGRSGSGAVSGGAFAPSLFNLTADVETPKHALHSAIYGSSLANGDLTLQGTQHATKTTSYVLLQPDGGNVGINTTAPTYALSFGNAADRALWIENSATDVAGKKLSVGPGSTVAGTSVDNVNGGELQLFSGYGTGTGQSRITFGGGVKGASGKTIQSWATRMTLTEDGFLGIGVVPSAYVLEIQKAVADQFRLFNTTHGGQTNLVLAGEYGDGSGVTAAIVLDSAPADSALHLLINSTTPAAALMTILSTGKVGINEDTPTSKLCVPGLTDYANNAAAVTGGLAAGAFYTETGTNPKRVCVVY